MIKSNRPKTSLRKKITVWSMAIFILIPGALGFGDKLYQFIMVLEKNPQGRFAIVPIMSYFVVSAGFIMVFIWGMMNGMLSDIEGPKYSMLEREKELDANEAAGAR